MKIAFFRFVPLFPPLTLMALAHPPDVPAPPTTENRCLPFPEETKRFVRAELDASLGLASEAKEVFRLLEPSNPAPVLEPTHPGFGRMQLAERLVWFGTRHREWNNPVLVSPLWKVRPEIHTKTDSERSPEQRFGARETNHVARMVLMSFLFGEFKRLPAPVQWEWYEASCRLWVVPEPIALTESPDQTVERRKADWIPSAEALLEWFAESEATCEEVRAAARKRLNSLRKRKEWAGRIRAEAESASPDVPRELVEEFADRLSAIAHIRSPGWIGRELTFFAVKEPDVGGGRLRNAQRRRLVLDRLLMDMDSDQPIVPPSEALVATTGIWGKDVTAPSGNRPSARYETRRTEDGIVSLRPLYGLISLSQGADAETKRKAEKCAALFPEIPLDPDTSPPDSLQARINAFISERESNSLPACQ